MLEAGSLPWAMPLLMQSPRGDGHPVMVLPGFITTDSSTRVLRRFLDGLGYDTHPWMLGRNLGPLAIGEDAERLVARLEQVHDQAGRKVSLVGWSLGGVMARLVSRRRPDLVRQIVTLGSPIAGHPRSTNAWRTYQRLTGHRIDGANVRELMAESSEAPPVPSTAIYTRGDGVVAWRNCREPESGTTDNIEVPGSHCGLGFNALVLHAVADRLALPEDGWAPFDRWKGARALLYPQPAAH